MTSSFSFIDLFCGIGGFHQALHALGGTCVLSCDKDKAARQTYVRNYASWMPLITNHFPSDITTLDAATIADFDVLCAGFPCQPFSQAGHKKGFLDAGRGNLFFDIMRIVDEKRPRVLFLENVRHLVKHDSGKTFARIQQEIEQRGYSFAWKILKASSFGLPQHRPRVYMVCFDKSQVPGWETFEFPQPIALTYTMSDVFGGKVDRDVGFTLRVGGRKSPLKDRRNWDGYVVDGKERRIGPVEGKKMMGFPDHFVFDVSETAAMKQLGNSVAVPVVQHIAERIMIVLEQHS